MAAVARDVVVVGASAGGLEAVLRLLSALPPDFPGALFVVVHLAPNSPSALSTILDRAGPLPASCPNGRSPIKRGRVYVPRPDQHLVIKPGYVLTTRGPQENGFRPAIDPLFRTAALAYGPRVVGIVLSGGLNDGTYGLSIVKEQGGFAIAQDPDEALVPSMPLSAIRDVEVDQILEIEAIAPLLVKLAASADGKIGSLIEWHVNFRN